jgi:tetratricopeptide (TPR) repeat protein
MKLLRIVLIAFFILGCSVKKPEIGKKAIPNEDEYIIKALLAENNGNYEKALNIYRFLYKKTQKKVYLEKIAEDLYRMKKYDEVLKLAQKSNDEKILEYAVFSLLNEGKYEDAKKLLLTRLNKKDEFFYSMMSYILLKEGKYNEALYYLKSLYALNPSKENLLSIVDLMIKLRKYNEALAYLRTHLNLYGCEYDVCIRLASIYKSLYDYDNLANIYEKLGIYNQKYIILALNIYIENGEFDKAKRLIEKYRLGDEYLLLLYEKMKKYKKAAYIALKLYNKTGDNRYLLKYCELMYAAHPNKKEIKDIVKKLKYLTAFYPNAYLYNFLGYLLIKYDINPKEGIEYVQKALLHDSQNLDYIDSLAWGYYKIGKCKEAWDIIKGIESDDKEIKYHKKMILKCIKEKNDFRKNNSKNKRRSLKKKK